MDKIKIGENEYEGNLRISGSGFIVCGAHVVEPEDILLSLNELAQLRQERDALKREIQEAVEIINRLQPKMKTDFAWLKRNTTPGGDDGEK